MRVESFPIEQVNHYLWRRQGFAWEAQSVWASLIGIYATSPTGYLSGLARDAQFRWADLDEWTVNQRQAVRLRAMRYSNFIIPVQLLPAVYQATKSQLSHPLKQMLKLGVSEGQYRELAADIESILETGTLTASEIKAALPPALANFGEALNYVIPQMCAEGTLVRAKTRGGWKSDLYEYARLAWWLPDINLNAMTPADGRAALARAYFDSYGPATLEDFRWWSGLSKGESQQAVAALSDELVSLEVAGIEHWLLAARMGDLRVCPAEAPQGVRLLPVWDAYLMAYKDRRRYLADEHFDRVYAKTGDATSTVLINGVVAGVWDFQEQKKTLMVKVALFTEVGPLVWMALREQVVRLAEAAGYPSVELLRCEPVSLKGGAQNLFKAPLKNAPGATIFKTLE